MVGIALRKLHQHHFNHFIPLILIFARTTQTTQSFFPLQLHASLLAKIFFSRRESVVSEIVREPNSEESICVDCSGSAVTQTGKLKRGC